jgi:hypothetical protein
MNSKEEEKSPKAQLFPSGTQEVKYHTFAPPKPIIHTRSEISEHTLILSILTFLALSLILLFLKMDNYISDYFLWSDLDIPFTVTQILIIYILQRDFRLFYSSIPLFAKILLWATLSPASLAFFIQIILIFAYCDQIIIIHSFAFLFIPAYCSFAFLFILYVFLLPAFLSPRFSMFLEFFMIFVYFCAAVVLLCFVVRRLEDLEFSVHFVVMPVWVVLVFHFLVLWVKNGLQAFNSTYLGLFVLVSVLIDVKLEYNVPLPWSVNIIPALFIVVLTYFILMGDKSKNEAEKLISNYSADLVRS